MSDPIMLRKQPHWDDPNVNNPEMCCSSDAVSVYADGSACCHSCGKQLFPHPDSYNYYDWIEGKTKADCKGKTERTMGTTMQQPMNNHVDDLKRELPFYKKAMYKSFPDRNIDIYTVQKFEVKTDGNGNVYFPYYERDTGKLCGLKIRTPQKEFRAVGKTTGKDVMLFGQQLFKGGGKFVTVHEGEFDAMAGYIMSGSKFANLSIPNGAKGAEKAVRFNIDYLETYGAKVLSFDGDKAGQEATEQTAHVFTPGTCKVIQHSPETKDACEYTKRNIGGVYMNLFWEAKVFTPSGIVNFADEDFEAFFNKPRRESYKYPWEGLNTKSHGLRKKELVTLCSGSGMGKSSITREITKQLLDVTEDNIGLLYLEEDQDRSKLGVMGMYADKPLHLDEVYHQCSKDEIKAAWDKSIATGRIFSYDHFGSTNVDEILNRVKYMIIGLQCEWVILDHLSIIVSGLEGDDERKCIDVAMTKLRTLVEETGAGLILVSHLKRVGGDKKSHEDGGKISLSHLRGSQSIAQLSDMVIGLERNQQAVTNEEANTTTIRILKNRYSGEVGVACHLYYNPKTGRMTEVEAPDALEEF